MLVTLENSKIIGGYRSLNMGVQKCQINRCLQLLSRPDGCEISLKSNSEMLLNGYKSIFIHRRCQDTESGRSTMPPFFRYLNPPMISEVH